MLYTGIRLQKGDILFVHGMHKATHRAIALGQAVISHNRSGGHARTVHAVLYAGDEKVVESSGDGLAELPIDTTIHWDAYHYSGYPGLRKAALQCAINRLGRFQNAPDEFGKYASLAAVGSLVRRSKAAPDVTSAQQRVDQAGSKTFCSNFVILCYTEAGLSMDPQMVPLPLELHTSPKELQGYLNRDRHWRYLGRAFQTAEG